ncbi:hypothetical protein [Actinophytocola algeriensis]|uniref:Phosphotransferase family enzyme n=1 Tax=Actinophytocola algeriensis TaxID=1768010 RepID=A0A7W7QBM9_9PSEU|nr:hypothetical protein [Actinophytocola algeriensis]MBB4910582.1 hypothetical protein [Actinophytocola algeriensis]MBE1480430.1 hypothetical protein [Actinophytocola algeriensis]
MLRRVECGLDVQFDREAVVTKRRSIGAPTDRGTWVRIERRLLAKIAAQGQPANGMEAAELLTGIAKPAWYGALSWRDQADAAIWRADEVGFVSAAPVRSRGSLREAPALSEAWWATFNASLDNLAQQRTNRLATPDTQLMTQALVTDLIERVFAGQVDTTLPSTEQWVPAHADLNWANLTAPDCWLLDWEDLGQAPRGLDAACLWVSSLAIPSLAKRLCHERQAELDTRSGKLMTLFYCAKVVGDAHAQDSPSFEPTARLAAHLLADLV